MPSPLLFSFLLFILPLLSLLLFSRRTKKHNLPPGPVQLPLIGNLHQLGELPHQSFNKLSQQHGPLMYLKLGTIPVIVASSADTAREFLKTHDTDSCSRPVLTSLYKLTYDASDIAFSPYGEQWRELRKICMLQLFSTKKVASFRSVREEEVEKVVRSISTLMVNNSQINLREESISLSNNIIFRSALGKVYYSEDPNDKGRLHEILDETVKVMGGFFVADYIPMLGFVDAVTGMRRRLEKNFRELDEFYQKVIDEHRDRMRKNDHWVSEDTVDSLLEIQMKEAHVTDRHIKGVLMNIFTAGTDTSATVIEWAMRQLMRNPEVMRKAQDEVRARVGSKGKVEESDLDQLNYLKSVVKETLRLHPPGPLLLQREIIKDFMVNGYDIPSKSRLFINVWAIGRDADAWERPEEFDPSRFIDNSINFMGQDFHFIPFGSGRRICPGMHSGWKKKRCKETIAMKRRERMINHGVDLEQINSFFMQEFSIDILWLYYWCQVKIFLTCDKLHSSVRMLSPRAPECSDANVSPRLAAVSCNTSNAGSATMYLWTPVNLELLGFCQKGVGLNVSFQGSSSSSSSERVDLFMCNFTII